MRKRLTNNALVGYEAVMADCLGTLLEESSNIGLGYENDTDLAKGSKLIHGICMDMSVDVIIEKGVSNEK